MSSERRAEEAHTEGGRTPEERARECLRWEAAPWDETAAKTFPRAQQLARDVLALVEQVNTLQSDVVTGSSDGVRYWHDRAEAAERALRVVTEESVRDARLGSSAWLVTATAMEVARKAVVA